MTPMTIPFQSGTLVILSDLHYDSYYRYALDPIKMWGLEDILWNADALILAGDLTNGPARNWPNVFQYLSEFIPPEQIYALPGNHDYYHGSLDDDAHLADAARKAGAHFVQKQVLFHGDTRLICCTLWTDFNLTNDLTDAMQTAQRDAGLRLDHRTDGPGRLLGRCQSDATSAPHQADRYAEPPP